jgi:hypothetical protein
MSSEISVYNMVFDLRVPDAETLSKSISSSSAFLISRADSFPISWPQHRPVVLLKLVYDWTLDWSWKWLLDS